VQVVWIGSPNHYTGDLYAIWALVIHTMGGTIESCDSWFKNPDSQVSSHYGTSLEGELHQYVSLDNGSWANGILEPGNEWVGYFGSSDNPNHHSITVETEDNGTGSTVVTDDEYAATLQACRLGLERWPGISTLTTHRVVSPSSRPYCAGDRWWSSGRLQQLARELGLDLLL